VATPTRTPHTDGVLLVREGHGRVTSLEMGRTPAGAWMLDGHSGRLQDGEGWTPPVVHQSILVELAIYYRPLASEQLTPVATDRACLEPSGVVAFMALLGWRASAEPLLPSLIASGPHGSMSLPTNDRCARPQRSRPSRSICPREAAPKLCRRLQALTAHHLDDIAKAARCEASAKVSPRMST
jgi:hypothetical protein